MNDIIETTQMVVSIHNHSIDEWVKGYNDLIKHQDAQQGYYFMVAKKALNLTFDEFAYSIGISVQTAVKKIKLYKDLKELGVVAPEKELPKSAQQNSVLKGTTPEEKADNYQLVKECTKNNTPTTKQIKEVMKSIEQPADIVKPSIKKSLRNDIRISNLKPVLNEEIDCLSNYQGPTVEALTESERKTILILEAEMQVLSKKITDIFPHFEFEAHI